LDLAGSFTTPFLERNQEFRFAIPDGGRAGKSTVGMVSDGEGASRPLKKLSRLFRKK